MPVVLQGDANLSRAQKEALQIIFGIWLVQKNDSHLQLLMNYMMFFQPWMYTKDDNKKILH